MFELNKLGRITKGRYENWLIVIQEQKNTCNEICGYIIAYWNEYGTEGYDDWCENKNDLEALIKEAFEIEWTNQDYIPRQPTEEEMKKVVEFQALAKKKGL